MASKRKCQIEGCEELTNGWTCVAHRICTEEDCERMVVRYPSKCWEHGDQSKPRKMEAAARGEAPAVAILALPACLTPGCDTIISSRNKTGYCAACSGARIRARQTIKGTTIKAAEKPPTSEAWYGEAVARVTPCTGVAHHWSCEPPAGPYSWGTCLVCGQSRPFKNTTPELDGGVAFVLPVGDEALGSARQLSYRAERLA